MKMRMSYSTRFNHWPRILAAALLTLLCLPMKRESAVHLPRLHAMFFTGNTWYVRPDGGVLYVASGGGGNTPHGGCNGLADVGYVAAWTAAYPSLGTPTQMTWLANTVYPANTYIVDNQGNEEYTADGGTSGSTYWPSWGATTNDNTVYWVRGVAAPTNLSCAVGDFRYLYDNQSYAPSLSWVIAGGDTVLVRGCYNVDEVYNGATYCRVGTSPPGHPDYWCVGGTVSGCSSGTIPAGTSGAHTTIEGQCVLAGNCSTGSPLVTQQANLVQIFGGNGVGGIINVQGTSYVDFDGFQVTDHADCVGSGTPAWPHACASGTDDYASEGFVFGNTSSNITLTDVWGHGLMHSALYGPIPCSITLTRVQSNFNGFAGWDMQDGADDPNCTGAMVTIHYTDMIGNGCNEEYPIVDAFPANSCYDLSSGGFGDSYSGQDNGSATIASWTMDHSRQIYNTKDGFVGPHVPANAITITDSESYGNMGQQWKWVAATGATVLMENTLTGGNCNRMSAQLPGAKQNFNLNTGLNGSYLSVFCRASADVVSISGSNSSTTTFINDTFFSYASTMFDLSCGANPCPSAGMIFKNNVYLGYTVPEGWFPSASGEPIGLYYVEPGTEITVTASYNDEFGVRNGSCPGSTFQCTDPLLYNEPTQTWTAESQLDSFLNTSTYGPSAFPNSGFYLASTSSPAYETGTTGGPANFSQLLLVLGAAVPQTSPPTMGAGPVFGSSPPPASGGSFYQNGSKRRRRGV